jgi:hypothetical protein
MNPCELVAKLNPGIARLDGGGRGGLPEYTAQDIAAAIGMVPNILARNVFCAVWWPDGGHLIWKQLDTQLAMLQFGEWRERADALVTAQLALAHAQFREDAMAVTRAELMLTRSRAAMWPPLHDQSYAAVRMAAVVELRAPRTCPECNGRGTMKDGDLVISCSGCGGHGKVSVSDAKRAGWLKRNESSYRRHWRDVYEWTFAEVSDAEKEGRAGIEIALGLKPPWAA